MRAQPLASDPSGSKTFNFLFHIDFVANLAEQRAQNALRQLQVRSAMGDGAETAADLTRILSARSRQSPVHSNWLSPQRLSISHQAACTA